MVCARKVVLKHNLQTCLAACFCSACRLQHYDSCYTNALYPGLVPKYEAAVVKGTVVMDTGVAPEGGGKKAKIVFARRQKTSFAERLTGTQTG